MKEVLNQIQNFKTSILNNKNIEVIKFLIHPMPPGIPDHEHLFTDQIASVIIDFYKQCNGFSCRWKSLSQNADISGSGNFLKMEEILSDNKEIVYQEGETEGSGIAGFHPVDFFNENACVGFYTGTDKNESMYYYDLVHEPQNLQLNIEGYFTLMLYVKAYRYWQYLILEILANEVSAIGNQLRDNIDKLFTDVSMDGFKELYTSNRLDKSI